MKIKIICILLAAAMSASLFSGCSVQDEAPDTDDGTPPVINTDPSPQEDPETQESLTQDPEEEPESPDVPYTEQTPSEETETIPEQTPETPTDTQIPTDQQQPEDIQTGTDAPPSDEVTPSQGEAQVKELPRDKFGLPLPLVTLSEDEAKLCLAETEEVDYGYFTDAVFLGDSVTLGLKNYTTKKRKSDAGFMSNASFIAVGSYGVYEALKTPTESTIHALYGGVQTQPQDILAAMGAKTVFICLGLNDVGLFSEKDHLIHYATLILRIQNTCPGIKIVIMSTTPLTVEGEKRHLYNYKIDTYNRSVIELAKQYNCYYADVTSVLKDDMGYLADELSSDNYCHLEDEAYDKIIKYLCTHATPDAVPSSSDTRETVVQPPAEVEGFEGPMGEW